MYKKEGYWNVKPQIKRLSFPKRGKFQVDLQDGRSVVMPGHRGIDPVKDGTAVFIDEIQCPVYIIVLDILF